jgi:uncharacterized ferritin-like protein (DUF455 family)
MDNIRSPEAPPESPLLPLADWGRWALDYLRADNLQYKLHPPALPSARFVEAHTSAHERVPEPLTVTKLRPGRPRELSLTWQKYKAPKSAHALSDAKKRAQLLHTFFHHELQAAELMCWAVLSFPDTPDAFVRGLLSICTDEIRHMNMYRAHIQRLGFEIGSFPVRDWFWERAPYARNAAEFLALMGLGFEAGNLDHSERFEQMFAEAGDHEASALMRVVGEEEVAHVAFAAHWFERLSGPLSFEAWLSALPAPLSPMVMRGRPLSLARRRRAGFSQHFLEQLSAWQPASPGG